MAKVKVKKSSDYLVNKKYYGSDEPSLIKSNADLVRAFTWYHNMCEIGDARQYLKDYFNTNREMIKMIDRIPDKRIPLTSAWLCRIVSNRNEVLQSKDLLRVNNDIKEALSYCEEEEEKPVEPKVKPSIQDRVKERLSDIIGDVEELVDKNEEFSMYDWLQKNQIPAIHASKIAEFYKPLRGEYDNALTDNEGYEHYTKKQIKFRLDLIHNIIEECERFSGNVKKTRKPRKKKEVTTDKLLRNFKYQKNSNEFKLTSINPSLIIGAQELWIFNTRYNVLTVFRARGPAGLSVKRTTITGYDESSTIGKRVGRKAEPVLKSILDGGKVTLRKVMDSIKSSNVTINGRINENTILLKVQK